MERINILLLDANEFAKVNGKVFYYANYHSFNMNGKVDTTWSNGWCPVSRFKVDEEGNVYGRIANELVPRGVYRGAIVSTSDNVLRYNYRKAMAS